MLQAITNLSDRTTTLLIKFLRQFLLVCATVLSIESLRTLALSIPISQQTIRKDVGVDNSNFIEFATCPKCHAIYPKPDVVGGIIDRCSFVRWPRHPQRRKRRPCNTLLYRGGNRTPKMVYCCRPVSQYLRDMVIDSDFLSKCNFWRERNTRDGFLADIYDGQAWKSEENGYLSSRYNLYGIMNVDWFQPFKHTSYSVGAIYMVILNLPRAERFKEENVLLLGLMPGPKEPKLNLNTYLRPIVDDLLSLADGKHFQDCSDLPATRKLGGFLSFHAKHGKSTELATHLSFLYSNIDIMHQSTIHIH